MTTGRARHQAGDAGRPGTTAEHLRLAAADAGREAWREWGPYVAERAWGGVREDYSADGDAWASFPFEQAHRRTYRWNEDGLSAWCDEYQNVLVGLALWNGRDPILKERPFGLGGPEGNHGEDAKDYWWYLENTPTHSFTRTRYAYPIAEFPYQDLKAVNASRDRTQPEYELIDTGVFDAGHVMVTSDWAKAGPKDLCLTVTCENRSEAETTLHILPTVWFRNVWSFGEPPDDVPRPRLWVDGAVLRGWHHRIGEISVVSTVVGADDPSPLLFCENETNVRGLYGTETFGGRPATRYPKDGINDHVVTGAPTVNPDQRGTKASFHHVVTIAAGGTAEIRLRLRCDDGPGDLDDDFTATLTARRAEADEFWAGRLADLPADRAHVVRQAYAGLLSSKQFYPFDVLEWLRGDPGQPAPPPDRAQGRNVTWKHLVTQDVILMPDPWEYPWFAAWDLAFHCVALAAIDPVLAKSQLLLLLHEWYQHPDGQIPAYEWNFSDVNPPVHAWAALQIFKIDGSRDTVFLERAVHKLLINFTWWVNRKDAEGDNLFEGGFLGLDNIGPFDRSQPLPDGAVLEQSDGTAWMAMYCLDMLNIALALAGGDHSYDDVATKFLQHFCLIASATEHLGLWDRDDGFYYDQIRTSDGQRTRVPVRSMVGLIPIAAVARITTDMLDDNPGLAERMAWLQEHRPELAGAMHFDLAEYPGLLAVCDPDRLVEICRKMLDTSEFLSPYGLRSLSAYHGRHPGTLQLGDHVLSVGYEPAESQTALFGGNSNWRGPVWFPLNALLISALRQYGRFVRDTVTVDLPTGSGIRLTLDQVADELSGRLMSLFLPAADGQRPSQRGLPWQDDVLFHEYFHAETGYGLGASHQTGWTAMITVLELRLLG